jgi:hypothetical protein
MRIGFRDVLLGCCLLAACSGSATSEGAYAETQEVRAEPEVVPGAAPVRGQPGVQWVPGMLGSGVALADRTPNLLRGDFDGDGIPDLLAVVAVRGQQLNPEVRVVRPWPDYDGDAPAGDDVTQGAEVGLAIIHGTPAARPAGVYLLHDPNPVSILDTQAARALRVVPRAELAAPGEPELARSARGDVIVVPTEAGIDTYLYWDGSTYRSLEPDEEP